MEIGKVIAAGVLPICAKTGRIMLIRRGLHQSKPGTWACVGGKYEPGDDKNPKDTAKREFVEETKFIGNYKISNLPLYINRSNHTVFYTFAGVFEEEFVPDLVAAGEAMDYGWFFIDELPEELLTSFSELLRDKKNVLKNIICFYSGKC